MSADQAAMSAPEPQSNQIAPIPSDVLQVMLRRLDVTVQPGALIKACSSVQLQPGLSPVDQVNRIFAGLDIKGAKCSLLRFARFDQHRLPALIYLNDQWQVLERVDAALQVTRDGKTYEVCDEQALQDQAILWISKPKQSGPSFFDRANPARSMVIEELFRTKKWLFDIVIATIIVNVLAVATAVFAMQIYDRVVPTLAYATMWTLVAGMVVVVCLDWLLKTLRARILDSAACAVDKALSQRVFEHVLKLQLDLRPQSLGTLAAQVGGLDAVRQFFSSGIVFALVDMPFALMFIAFIFVIGGDVGWVYLVLLPVAALLGFVSQLKLRRLFKEQLIRSNERQGLLVESIGGLETIRSSNASWRFAETWRDITQSIARYNVKQKAISNLTSTTAGSLATVAYVSAIVVGVWQIADGFLTMGGLIACSILGGRVIAPIAQGVQYLAQWQNVSQSLELVNQVLLIETDRSTGANLLVPDITTNRLELDGVRFSYPDSPVAQVNVKQLSFKAGDRVAILGAVGSGKSTLLKVLSGLYKPAAGRVRLGNADLWEIDPNVVAQHIGYLPQTTHLFQGTLRTNVALSGAVSDTQFLVVCQALGIDRIANDNPKGLDLPISEGGDGLSGGQRQLVGLARVFAARPRVWLLDEPTASLDQDAEGRLNQALANYVQADDIVLISTHRPMALAGFANRMLLMRQGEIVADGSPEAIMARLQAERHASQQRGQNAAQSAGMAASRSGGSANVI